MSTDEPEIIRYFCGKCGYKFSFNTTKKKLVNLRCPYCGRDDMLERDRTDAASILDEVSSNDFDDRQIGPSAKFYGRRI